MIRNFFKIIIISSFITGCSAVNFDRDTVAKTSSSAVGGYLGYELSDGDIFSTTFGSAVGILLGSYLSEFLGQDDYYFYKKETIKVLEINDNNNFVRSGHWKNPKSGNEGVVVIKGHYGGPECRLIEHTFFLNSESRKTLDTACREKSGQWAMVK
jgi:surface antigen